MLQTNTRKSPRGHCVSGQWKTLQLALICHRLRESQAISDCLRKNSVGTKSQDTRLVAALRP